MHHQRPGSNNYIALRLTLRSHPMHLLRPFFTPPEFCTPPEKAAPRAIEAPRPALPWTAAPTAQKVKPGTGLKVGVDI